MIISCPTPNDRRLLIRYLSQLGEPVFWPSASLDSWIWYPNVKWEYEWIGTLTESTIIMEDFIGQIKGNNMQIPRR